MKAMKIALLGTAALAAVSVSARADNLSDLKAQIEALNSRVASLETTPSMPAGYQMVSFSKVGNEHVISIMPTADMPASTVISWSGNVRAAVVAYQPYTNGISSVDVVTHAGLGVKATTDTAVGEVGVKIGIKMTGLEGTYTYNSGQSGLQTDHFVGWWKMTPNLTLSGGNSNSIQSGSLSKNSYQFDSICSCYETDYNGSMFNNPAYNDAAQIALAYADGPLGFAVAVEDAANNYYYPNPDSSASAFGVAAKATYKMDTFGFDLSGGYWGNPNGALGYGDASWNVNVGVGGKFDAFSIGASVGTGSDYGYDFTRAGGYVTVALGSAASAEFGLTHNFDGYYKDETVYSGGLYYSPVSKLVLGVEGEYTAGSSYDGRYVADFISVFNF